MPQLESRVSAGRVTGGSDTVIANRAGGGTRLLRPRIANLAYALRDTGDIDAPDKFSAAASVRNFR